MLDTRLHVVIAGVAVVMGIFGAAIYMLISGERGGWTFLGWVVMLVAVCHPSLLASMKSERQDRCTQWLRRIAGGQGPAEG